VPPAGGRRAVEKCRIDALPGIESTSSYRKGPPRLPRYAAATAATIPAAHRRRAGRRPRAGARGGIDGAFMGKAMAA
jgi:hypothetical protein